MYGKMVVPDVKTSNIDSIMHENDAIAPKSNAMTCEKRSHIMAENVQIFQVSSLGVFSNAVAFYFWSTKINNFGGCRILDALLA